MKNALAAALLLVCASCTGGGHAFAKSLPPYAATVVRVVDGDTILIAVAAWAGTPFDPIKVRVAGIDTPESRKPPPGVSRR